MLAPLPTAGKQPGRRSTPGAHATGLATKGCGPTIPGMTRTLARRLLVGLPFLLPPLALAVLVWLQPADHMGAFPDRAPWLGRLVYDDWDWSAVLLRGLNASLGRKAGRAGELQPSDAEFLAGMDASDRFFEERY